MRKIHQVLGAALGVFPVFSLQMMLQECNRPFSTQDPRAAPMARVVS